MPTNTMTIDEILQTLWTECFNGKTLTVFEVQQYQHLVKALNALILAEFMELINSQKPTYIFSATNGKEDTAINKDKVLAAAQRKYGEKL